MILMAIKTYSKLRPLRFWADETCLALIDWCPIVWWSFWNIYDSGSTQLLIFTLNKINFMISSVYRCCHKLLIPNRQGLVVYHYKKVIFRSQNHSTYLQAVKRVLAIMIIGQTATSLPTAKRISILSAIHQTPRHAGNKLITITAD